MVTDEGVTDSDFLIYDHNGIGWELSYNIGISADFTRKTPVCYDGYCYVQADIGTVYKIDMGDQSVDASIQTGLGTANTDEQKLTICDADSGQAGLELLWISESSTSSEWLDVSWINLNSVFNVGNTDTDTLAVNSTKLKEKIICGDLDGSPALLTSTDLYGTNNKYGDFVRFHISGSSLVIDKKFTISSVAPTNELNSRYDGDVLFADVNDDGDDEYCGIRKVRNSSTTGVKTKLECYYDTDTLAINKTYHVDAGTQEDDIVDHPATAYVVDMDADNKDEIIFGSYYFNPETTSYTDMGDSDDWHYTRAFIGNATAGCLNYYYHTTDGTMRGKVNPDCFGAGASTPPTPPINATPETLVFVNETFTTGAFNLQEADCREGSFLYGDMHVQTPVSLDNDWYCYVENKTASYVNYINDSSIYHAKTPMALSTVHYSSVYPQYDTFATFPTEFHMVANDWIEFSCSLYPPYIDGWNYLVLGSQSFVSTYPIAISLQNGGCADNSTVLGGNLDSCVELIDITGNDCNNSVNQNFSFQVQDVLDVCGFECGELNFEYISRIDIWRNKYSDNGTFYLDDLLIHREDVAGNNSLPYIIFVSPIPNPQNVSQIVSWSVSIGDTEDPSGNIWSKFDCGDDGILDYNWGKRGVSLSFDCAYLSTGNYTGTAYASDDAHYPSSFDIDTAIVEILELEEPDEPITGGDCIGFSAPTCTGTCYFYDDFGYNNPIECNGWDGFAKDVNPSGGVLGIYGLDGTNYFEFDGDDYSKGSILESQYEDFEIEFRIRLNNYHSVNFYVLDEELDQYSISLVFDNFNAIVYDPSGTTIKSLTPETWYKFEIEVDLATDTILWYVDDTLEHSGNFFDGATDSQRLSRFSWSSPLTDFDLDYFRITYGTQQANYTAPEEEITYVYNPDLFCAINWTTNVSLDRFDESYCTMRGYNTNYPLLSLCIPRACLSDISNAVFNSATTNIFITIVIVTAFILIAPLLIKARR
jgi:hypothetical protein